MHQAVPELQPSNISVTEKYVYEAIVSGVKQANLKERSGNIEVTVPYDRHRYLQHQATNEVAASSAELALLNSEIGRLQVSDYGRSNLNLQPDPNWDENTLPVRPRVSPGQLRSATSNRLNRFNLHMTHTYQPVEPESPPLKVIVHVLDEDYIEDDTVEIASELKKQAGLKRNLVMRIRVILTLPEHLGHLYEKELLKVSRMALVWPLATPYYLASLYVGSLRQAHALCYDPEQKQIEWTKLPLKLRERDSESQVYTFSTDVLRLEISEPAQLYQQSAILGSVSIELNGLLSGLRLEYQNEQETVGNIPVTLRTVLENNFELSLVEGLKRKYFSPKQHLQFPNVVFDDLRLADIIMLLEDNGFKLVPTRANGNADSSEETGEVIKAVRAEGTRNLTLYMLTKGIDSRTQRERKIPGEEKYTTELPTGSTVVYVRGQLQGDRKRVVSVVNDIQKQLKEQFRHVSTVE